MIGSFLEKVFQKAAVPFRFLVVTALLGGAVLIADRIEAAEGLSDPGIPIEYFDPSLGLPLAYLEYGTPVPPAAYYTDYPEPLDFNPYPGDPGAKWSLPIVVEDPPDPPDETPTPTVTPTPSPSPTPQVSTTASPTALPTTPVTQTPTPPPNTATPTPSPTPTLTSTPTAPASTPTETSTPIATLPSPTTPPPSKTPVPTATPTKTPSPTPTATQTSTSTPTAASTPIATPVPDEIMTPTSTPLVPEYPAQEWTCDNEPSVGLLEMTLPGSYATPTEAHSCGVIYFGPAEAPAFHPGIVLGKWPISDEDILLVHPDAPDQYVVVVLPNSADAWGDMLVGNSAGGTMNRDQVGHYTDLQTYSDIVAMLLNRNDVSSVKIVEIIAISDSVDYVPWWQLGFEYSIRVVTTAPEPPVTPPPCNDTCIPQAYIPMVIKR